MSTTVSQTDATIFVTTTDKYWAEGTIKIGREIIYYTGKTNTSFTGCIRGIYGTTPRRHRRGAEVSYFAFPEEVINKVFAHECGHLVGLEHMPRIAHNIMYSTWAGSTIDNGYWNTFIGTISSLTGEFVVKQ